MARKSRSHSTGKKNFTTAQDGRWKTWLKPMAANAAPQTMSITGDNTVLLTNILVGDVWVASGQSNMERQLGPRVRQKMIENWQEAVATANYPQIREYYVPEHLAFAPVQDANGRWAVCSPETVKDFSAVGYFFARDVYEAEKIPVGILFTAVGGTPAEAWTGAKSLGTMPDFRNQVKLIQKLGDGNISTKTFHDEEIANWYETNDSGSKPGANWQVPGLSLSDWGKTYLPNVFFNSFPGIIWFRKQIDVPVSWTGKIALLHLGKIDDADTTWVNGVPVGATDDWNVERIYSIPAGVLKSGLNTIAVRVLNNEGPGGFNGSPIQFSIKLSGQNKLSSIPLAGPWNCRTGGSFESAPAFPQEPVGDYNAATVLYNGMIAPLQAFPVKGVIWYQGENNNDHAKQYRKLFPLLISDWRQSWHCGEFPFLFVQIAPHRDLKPELREAQFLTLKKSPNTAMAVITDAGDADDIHPARKQVPGMRLALAARVLGYGEKLEYSGPLFDSMQVQGDKAAISFTHVGEGLVARNGVLKGFTIASADKKFLPAQTAIQGGKVIVWNDQAHNPKAVRYGWANVPDGNLYNKNNLPASPFRTDDDEP
jgi:sialate O-acetylesterase